ncbi:hypothetical protein vBVpaMR16F_5 [Vibrio phage vB_VpaM_R16F]|nr:hypothetical protein vBVpaMR16F_5 [Vibrio phage vB_VpaM_R16F]
MFEVSKSDALTMAIEYIEVSKEFLSNPSYCSDDQLSDAKNILIAYYNGASSYQILSMPLYF